MPGAASTSHAFLPNMGWEAIRSQAVHFINKVNQLSTAIPQRSSPPQRLVSHLHRPAKLGTAPEGGQHSPSLILFCRTGLLTVQSGELGTRLQPELNVCMSWLSGIKVFSSSLYCLSVEDLSYQEWKRQSDSFRLLQ